MSALPRWMHRGLLRAAHPVARSWWWLTRPRVRGAYVVVRRNGGTPREAWLFVRHSYKPGLSVPGGGIDRDESPRAAARRELAEEVGLDLSEERLEATRDFEIEYLHRLDHVHFFAVELAGPEPATPAPDRREITWAGFIELRDVDRDELVAPVRRYLEELERRDRPGPEPG